jgi:hypothetical protein
MTRAAISSSSDMLKVVFVVGKGRKLAVWTEMTFMTESSGSGLESFENRG